MGGFSDDPAGRYLPEVAADAPPLPGQLWKATKSAGV